MRRIFRFPLKQNIGAKAAPTVVEGDKIVRGQLLASVGESELGANLFSSVSGSVTGIDENEIRVQADEMQSGEYRKLSGSDPLELIREAGIVGLGGAGFPTYYKLKEPFKTDGIVIINAAECEPILGHNIAAITGMGKADACKHDRRNGDQYSGSYACPWNGTSCKRRLPRFMKRHCS